MGTYHVSPIKIKIKIIIINKKATVGRKRLQTLWVKTYLVKQ